MKTQTVTIRRFTPGDSSGNNYTTQVTLSAPPFAVPSEGEARAIERESGAAMRNAGREAGP